MWTHLQREGIPVAKSTVERLMRANGWQGVRRQKKVRTTIAAPAAEPAAERAPDLVGRQFQVAAPNQLLVADFTYVRLVTGVSVLLFRHAVGRLETVLVLTAGIGIVAIWLWILVQALRIPDERWSAAGQSKGLWIFLIVVLGLVGSARYLKLWRRH